jgi:hypothetical protein
MKKENVYDRDYLHVVNIAIANAVFAADTQIVFDGEDFHWEEVVCQDFIRGYVIKHNDYSNVQIPDEIENVEVTNEFDNWLTDELLYHADKCLQYFNIKKMKTLKELQQELLRNSETDYIHEFIKALDLLTIAEGLDLLEAVKKKYWEMFSGNPTKRFGKQEPNKPPAEDYESNDDNTYYSDLPF